MIPLDGMSVENAGIGVVPGSHAIIDEEALSNRNLDADKVSAVYPKLRLGDVLVVHSRLVHGGGPNRGGRDRELMVVQFGKRSVAILYFSAESEYLTLCQRSEMVASTSDESMNRTLTRSS